MSDKKYFERYGYNVVPFASSEEALAYIQNHLNFVDLVLTDSTMPQLQGVDLVAEVHEIIHNS